MTAKDESPGNGHESTESENCGRPLRDATDREVAVAVEEAAENLQEGATLVREALLNEEVPLTDEKVSRMWDAASRLERLSETAVLRVEEDTRGE